MFRVGILLPVFSSATATTTSAPHVAAKKSTDQFMIKDHGFVDNELVYYEQGTGSAIAGFTDKTMYFVTKVDANVFSLHLVDANGTKTAGKITVPDLKADNCGSAKFTRNKAGAFQASAGVADANNPTDGQHARLVDASNFIFGATKSGTENKVCKAAGDMVRVQSASAATAKTKPFDATTGAPFYCYPFTANSVTYKLSNTKDADMVVAAPGIVARTTNERVIVANFQAETAKELCAKPATTKAASSAYRTSASVAVIAGVLSMLL